MMAVTPCGHILDAFGLFPATFNDATILQKIFDADKILEYFRKGDVLLLDRGFRDIVPKLKEFGFDVRMPSLLKKKQSQFDWKEANDTRIITKFRQVVERVNNRLKQFKLLKNTYCNKSLPTLYKYIRIASAIINCFYPALKTDNEDYMQIVKLFEEKNKPNELVHLRLKSNQNLIEINQSNVQFPHLTLPELRILASGQYQLRLAIAYYSQYVIEKGIYNMKIAQVNNEVIESIISKKGLQDPFCIQAVISSRFQGRVKHKVYVLVDLKLQSTDAIISYYCSCKNGQRTIGMCAHAMAIVWYLSYARHMEHLSLPAANLLNILKN